MCFEVSFEEKIIAIRAKDSYWCHSGLARIRRHEFFVPVTMEHSRRKEEFMKTLIMAAASMLLVSIVTVLLIEGIDRLFKGHHLFYSRRSAYLACFTYLAYLAR